MKKIYMYEVTHRKHFTIHKGYCKIIKINNLKKLKFKNLDKICCFVFRLMNIRQFV